MLVVFRFSLISLVRVINQVPKGREGREGRNQKARAFDVKPCNRARLEGGTSKTSKASFLSTCLQFLLWHIGSAGPRCAERQGLFSYRCPSGLNSKITHTHTQYGNVHVVRALPKVHITLLLAVSIFGCIVGDLPGITNQPRTAHE